MTDIAIRTENLTRNFGSLRAVENLSIEVPPGIIFGFLGPNGAGKTTTIRLLLGLLEPTSGRAEVLGFDVRTHADEIRYRTGTLLEYPGLYERLSAEDNLDFWGRVWHMSPTERQIRTKELLTHLDLWDRRKERVGTWSRGMKQKLAVARAIFHRPHLLFLDEPTVGLDPVAAAQLRGDLTTLVNREGVTAFLTTHNMAEAEKLCERVGVIRQGKLLAVGHPGQLRVRRGTSRVEIVGRGFTQDILVSLRERPEVAAVELQNGRLVIDLHGEVDIGPLVTCMVNVGIEVEEVHRSQSSLEEVFLTLMREEP